MVLGKLDKVIINKTHEFNCYEYHKVGQIPTDSFSVVISADDFQPARNAMENINTIDIVDGNGTTLLSTTDYDRYREINFQSKSEYTRFRNPETKDSVDTFKITFKSIDLEEKVKRLIEKVDPVFDESSMTIQGYCAYKKKELGEICRQKIYEGCDVVTEYGTEHFTFNADDQMNLNTTYLAALNTGLPQSYHPSTDPSSPCTVYSAKDIISIYLTLQSNLLYHQTYCNMLNTLLGRYSTKAEMKTVTYGMELPSDLKEKMDIALANGQDVVDAIMTKAGITQPDSSTVEGELSENETSVS